ncbi:IPT/TIG domain-containing protein [Streptomyces sp. NPDC057474]|uniref:IPT/TIG domain-containing protein n=1 Tax=Streptomyces sp. NPDC057474 TaxID=3346144 RepID=UPI0036C90A8D
MPPPVVSSVSPNQGSTSGGTTVTVTGSNFTGATIVRFGAKPATSYTVDSPTQITAVTPSGIGTVNVTVSTTQGTSVQVVLFTYVTAPSLSGLSPNQGPVSGGTTVTLTGANLSGATAVQFGGVAAASFTVNSSTQITAVAPTRAAGAAAVTVTTPGGTSNALTFTYIAAPSVTGVSPNQGPVSGGTTVTLTGANFSGATAVQFGGVAASSFTVDSSTQITAVAPAHAVGAVAVTVTTPGGTSNPAGYVYLDAPVLVSLVPDLGPTDGGTVVTLTGSDLAATTTVQFGAVSASFTVASPTQITTVVPTGPAGPVTVTVTTPAGTSNGLTYTRIAAPGI